MNGKEAIDLINDLADVSEIVDILNKNNWNRVDLSFGGLEATNVSFIGHKNVSLYKNTLDKLYTFNKKISSTVSIDSFQKKLINLIRKVRDSKTRCLESDFKNLINSLLEDPLFESDVFFNIYGAKMTKEVIKLGAYTIYNYPLAYNNLKKLYSDHKLEMFLPKGKGADIKLCVKVKSRDNSKAYELAGILASSFESVINYMISDLRHIHYISVLNLRSINSDRTIIINDYTIGQRNEALKYSEETELDDEYFKSSKNGNKRIWDLLEKESKSKFERRIIQAIEWIGKGLIERDIVKRYVQFVFSIESMLKFDEKQMITPSITSQISEWLAFMIEENAKKRKEVETKVKAVYGLRSSIVHGSSNMVEKKDLYEAYEIAILMMNAILTKEPFCNVKTMEDLKTTIDKLKYK